MGKKEKYDAEYISYIESGESAAVFVARDIVRSINTTGKWIDIVDLKDRRKYEGRWDFDYFIIELFPRKRSSKYPAGMDDEGKKYITWQTAHIDITEQRAEGYKGTRFKICPKLVNRNKGKNKKPKWDYDILSITRL